MKRTWKVILMAVVFGLVVSGCGSNGETTQSEGNNSAVSTNTENQMEKNERKENQQDNDSFGKIEILGEKTKKIGRFEFTLESGEVYKKVKQTDGQYLESSNGEFLVIKTTAKALRKVTGAFSEFSVYESDESNFGEDNYIGITIGKLGQPLENNLVFMNEFPENNPVEGYLYLDVTERETYRIVYADDYETKGYWDIKITK
ncbi:hypothetical protein [Paenibacillus popilliae]|uniref:DUF4352 domain-containing protein n=1 Tax=Paenibacillus popilliae TaxID=78057 RepID=A0ABY3AQD5_PAEPP|nr:hypothetical protein [Paenibacillus sp. SDF0028]TQR44216.1 hypothetical protein C7Y44_13735 [Paenibacillus sp. SDF0028]